MMHFSEQSKKPDTPTLKQGVWTLASNKLDAQKKEGTHADPPLLVQSVGEDSGALYHVGIEKEKEK